jgi:hypothetical protein
MSIKFVVSYIWQILSPALVRYPDNQLLQPFCIAQQLTGYKNLPSMTLPFCPYLYFQASFASTVLVLSNYQDLF